MTTPQIPGRRFLLRISARAAIASLVVVSLIGCHGGSLNIASRPSGPRDCAHVQGNWVVPVQLPVVANSRQRGGLAFVNSVADVGNAYCSLKGVRPFVIENESPVLVGSGSGVEMTVEGNICDPSPKFIIYSIPFTGKRNQDYSTFRQIFGSSGSVDPMLRRISAALAVATKRCGTEPRELRFIARKIHEVPATSAINSRWGKVPFEYTDFYSGRVTPRTSMRVISDNRELEEEYWRIENQRANAAEREREEKSRRQAVGAAVALLLMGAIRDSNCRPDNNVHAGNGGC